MSMKATSRQDEHDDFDAGHSGAALTFPSSYNSLRKGGHVIIDDRPCRIVDVRLYKVGKHGHGKVSVVAIDIFTDKRREVVQPSTHTAYVPIVKKQEYLLVDMGSAHMSLLDDKGNMVSDIRVPENPLAQEIRSKMDDEKGNSILIVVQSSMNEDKVIGYKTGRE